MVRYESGLPLTQLALVVVAVTICGLTFLTRGLPPDCALHKAASCGDLEQVVRNVKWGGGVNRAEPGFLWTPLHHAARNEHVRVARFLVRSGAIVDARSSTGDPPLAGILSSSDCALDTASVLLDGGADINMRIRGPTRWTALHQAARYGRAGLVELFLSRGADVSLRDGDGQTPLHQSTKSGSLDTVKALVLAGASLDTKDYRGRTASMIAKSRHHWTIAQFLDEYAASCALGKSESRR